MLPTICFIGETGAGKDTAALHVKSLRQSYEIIIPGHLWDEDARMKGILEEGKGFSHYERSVYQKGVVVEKGESYLTDLLMRKIKNGNPWQHYLISGIRHQISVDALKAYFKEKVIFAGVVAGRERRFRRLEKRDEKEKLTREQFEEREKIDRVFNIGRLIEQCDVIIPNDFDDKKLFYSEVEIKLEGWI